MHAIAVRAGPDARDLEAALVRLALRHRRLPGCPGGRSFRPGWDRPVAEGGTNGPTGPPAGQIKVGDADTEVTR